jgi:hypothetical protein
MIFLLIAGTATGALTYYRRWPDPSPAVFGYHEVFHVYVSAAAACQYTAPLPPTPSTACGAASNAGASNAWRDCSGYYVMRRLAPN